MKVISESSLTEVCIFTHQQASISQNFFLTVCILTNQNVPKTKHDVICNAHKFLLSHITELSEAHSLISKSHQKNPIQIWSEALMDSSIQDFCDYKGTGCKIHGPKSKPLVPCEVHQEILRWLDKPVLEF